MLSVQLGMAYPGRGGTAFSLDAGFEAPPGVSVLFGPSGAGKSTVLAAVAGIRRPERGRVVLGNRVLLDTERGIDVPIRGRRVGLVFQQLALFEHLRVDENVGYGLGGVPRKERARRVGAMLERLGIGALGSRRPSQLSGGERQRVALARSLASEPDALLLDEPFSALDAATREALIADLRGALADRPVPVLLVTHDRAVAIALGSTLLALESGRIVAAGPPLAVLGAPRTLGVATLAGFENVFTGTVVELESARGTMCLQLGPTRVHVPLGGESPGGEVQVAISARDILLAAERPGSTSARNVLRGTIRRLEERDAATFVEVDCGVPIVAVVTREASEELALERGAGVWVAFKAHACHLLRNTASGTTPAPRP
jgi:molybdate transport system ATP-binding protein